MSMGSSISLQSALLQGGITNLNREGIRLEDALMKRNFLLDSNMIARLSIEKDGP
jgi:hypothetical protein